MNWPFWCNDPPERIWVLHLSIVLTQQSTSQFLTHVQCLAQLLSYLEVNIHIYLLSPVLLKFKHNPFSHFLL